MRSGWVGLALLALAGCAADLPPEPQAARLTPTALILDMSSGQRCRLERSAAAFDGPAGWGGPVQGCAGVARVDVDRRAPGPLERFAEALFGALTLEELVSPPGEVRVIGPQGRVWLFASPPPVDG